jgi:biopolymer transport protein ExbD
MALKTLGHGGSHDYSTEGDSGIVAEINITPLTDIFLVLLIIFMVTSSVMSQLGVDVSLPKASNATAQAQPEGVIVTLLPGGEIRVNQDQIQAGDYAALEDKLKKAFAGVESRLVILEGDRKSFLGSAIEVMDHARKAGANRFAIATSPES